MNPEEIKEANKKAKEYYSKLTKSVSNIVLIETSYLEAYYKRVIEQNTKHLTIGFINNSPEIFKVKQKLLELSLENIKDIIQINKRTIDFYKYVNSKNLTETEIQQFATELDNI